MESLFEQIFWGNLIASVLSQTLFFSVSIVLATVGGKKVKQYLSSFQGN